MDVLPQNAGSNKTTSAVTISLSKPAPPEGCTVSLKIEPVAYSGGHNHNGNRPKGIVNPDMITIPGCTMGVASATYNSSGVAGEEKIIAEIDGSIKNQW
ncbi:MAG: hypothetical protein HY752_03395 [Nitrospirae bacterium]|nr:hypothetical protein [Nitrospirota bacterium]